MSHQKILVILGPTAIGKTNLALFLAKKFNGELVSCDSRQVYVGLDIGTGKLPNRNWKLETGSWKRGKGYWEVDGIKIWVYDVVSPKKQYTVYDYVRDASRVIGEIRERGKLPTIVGGSGLYLKALLYGLSNLAIPVDKNLRKKLQKLSKENLQERLKKLSFKRWNSLNASDRENPRRLVRAIEMEMMKGNMGDKGNQGDKRLKEDFDFLKIGLTASREVLYKRVDRRVIKRINQGMVEEAQNLHKTSLSFKRMRQLGLEYGVLADYLKGKLKSKEKLIEIMQNKIHRFVRHQLTWFKKEKDVHWFDVNERMVVGRIENLVRQWYDIGV